jgi:hypothetical protein
MRYMTRWLLHSGRLDFPETAQASSEQNQHCGTSDMVEKVRVLSHFFPMALNIEIPYSAVLPDRSVLTVDNGVMLALSPMSCDTCKTELVAITHYADDHQQHYTFCVHCAELAVWRCPSMINSKATVMEWLRGAFCVEK